MQVIIRSLVKAGTRYMIIFLPTAQARGIFGISIQLYLVVVVVVVIIIIVVVIITVVVIAVTGALVSSNFLNLML